MYLEYVRTDGRTDGWTDKRMDRTDENYISLRHTLYAGGIIIFLEKNNLPSYPIPMLTMKTGSMSPKSKQLLSLIMYLTFLSI